MALAGGSGCLRHLHPIQPCAHEVQFSPRAMPRCCQTKVHIFILHGTDPLDYANLAGLRDYCVGLGYCNAHLGQCFHGKVFRERICEIRQADPHSRFVILGFSAGANAGRNLVNRLHDEDGIDVDLLVYMGGNTLKNDVQTRPPRVGKVVNILATGAIWHGSTLSDAENVGYEDVWHFGSPSHPHTLELLERELRQVALRVPEEVYVPPPPVRPAPRPEPVSSPQPDSPDEWDFLKPTDYLRAHDEETRPAGQPRR